MSEENISNKLIQTKLDTLRNEIMEFAKAVNDCSIIMTSHHSELIGEINGSLNYGTLVADKTKRQEYDVSIDTYNKFKRKLIRCNCK